MEGLAAADPKWLIRGTAVSTPAIRDALDTFGIDVGSILLDTIASKYGIKEDPWAAPTQEDLLNELGVPAEE